MSLFVTEISLLQSKLEISLRSLRQSNSTKIAKLSTTFVGNNGDMVRGGSIGHLSAKQESAL